MSYEWSYRSVFIGPNFVECPQCHTVVTDELFALQEPVTAMPCCNATGTKPRWPSSSVLVMLDVVRHRDTFAAGGEPIRFTFLAAMLEALLEPIVFRLSMQRIGERRAEQELRDNHGAAKLQTLFDRHCTQSLLNLCLAAGQRAFMNQWREVARMRNQFAHGKMPVVGRAQATAADELQESALRLFAYIHNHARAKSA